MEHAAEWSLRGELREQLARELDPGETVLWCAQPDPQRYLAHFFTHLVLGLSIIWFFAATITGLSVFERYETWVEQRTVEGDALSLGSYMFTYWGWLIPVVVGLALSGLSVLAWFSQRGVARRTAYAITECRAIVLVLGSRGTVYSSDYRGEELIHTSRKQWRNGVGDIRFESARASSGHPGRSGSHGFVGIADVIEVERLLRKQFGNHASK